MNHKRISREASQDAKTNSPYKGNAQEFEGDVTLQRIVWAEDSQEVELLGVWWTDEKNWRAMDKELEK
jgi:hypothetical protein